MSSALDYCSLSPEHQVFHMRDFQLLGVVLDPENFVLRNGENQTVYQGTFVKVAHFVGYLVLSLFW
jgi:hypothetical protein